MHEAMVAESVLSAILAECRTCDRRPVSATISCGQLNVINDEAFNLAFEALAAGSVCEGLKIEIEHKPFQGRCRQCDTVFEIVFSHASCPSCKQEDFEILPDAPLLLETIEFEE
jgi:hydrogenase nickel incorporation protein HypA/HybF